MWRTWSAMLMPAFVAGFSETCPARTIHVPAEQPTIQAGVDAASNGDEIVLADGTYSGPGNRDILIQGKALTVRSANGPDACTIDIVADGGMFASYGGFMLEGAATIVTVFQGLTIYGGHVQQGGAIRCVDGGMSIINCRFLSNQAVQAGGAIYLQHGALLIEDSAFIGNFATGQVTAGGAIWMDNSIAHIENCDFLQNRCLNPKGGSGSGGAIDSIASDLTLINCRMAANGMDWNGGGGAVQTWFGGTLSVVNCTIAFNEAAGGCGGIGIDGGTALFVRNSILWGNFWTYSNPAQQICSLTATDVEYCDIQFGYVGEGNIDAEPDFVDAKGPDAIIGTGDEDLRLAAGSPCIDAASNPAVPRGVTEDLDGNPRFQDDPATTDTGLGRAPIIDMGAYEFQPPLDPADLDHDGDVDGFDLALLLAAWGNCPLDSICGCPADLDCSGRIDGIDLALLLGVWG